VREGRCWCWCAVQRRAVKMGAACKSTQFREGGWWHGAWAWAWSMVMVKVIGHGMIGKVDPDSALLSEGHLGELCTVQYSTVHT
jgi:hypothetical protein